MGGNTRDVDQPDYDYYRYGVNCTSQSVDELGGIAVKGQFELSPDGKIVSGRVGSFGSLRPAGDVG